MSPTSVLDLTTRSIDLVTELSRSSGVFSEQTTQLLQWIGRERISKSDFFFAVSKAQDFAQPNKMGLTIIDELNVAANMLFGIQLVIPGAVARTITCDLQLRWLATSSAVFLKHLDLKLTSNLLAKLLVRLHIDKDDSREDIFEDRILPVSQKMTSSFAFHSVNVKNGLKDLPPQLRDLPRPRWTLAITVDAIHEIQRYAGASLVCEIQYNEFVLIDWIYHHWNGKLVVALDNTIHFEQQLGVDQGTITILFAEPSCREADCSNNQHEAIISIYPISEVDPDVVMPAYKNRSPAGQSVVYSNTDGFAY
jgi:hypothetical protein